MRSSSAFRSCDGISRLLDLQEFKTAICSVDCTATRQYLPTLSPDVPRVWGVEDAVDGLAARHIDYARALVVDKVVEGSVATPDRHLDVGGGFSQRYLRARELHRARSGVQVQLFCVGRQMCVQISKHRIEINVQDHILEFAVDHIFDSHSKRVARRKGHRLLTCRIQERDGVDGRGVSTATTMRSIR